MFRWTETTEENVRLSDFSDFVTEFSGWPVLVIMNDGRKLRGMFRQTRSGNNAGLGRWSYYAGFTLETEEGEIEVDYLDVSVAMRSNSN